VLQAKMAGRSGHRERLQRSEVVVVASGPCLLLLRRRRESIHHHAKGDTQGEEITPYLKQEATTGCGGPSAYLVSQISKKGKEISS